MSSDLSAAERRALDELWQADALNGANGKCPVFPGAVGRAGAWLVKRGLAEKLGLFTYEPGCRYMRYQITGSARDAAVAMRIAGKDEADTG